MDEVTVKWSGKEYKFSVEENETVAGLKRKIELETRVLAKRQKLIGLKVGGKLAGDECLVSALSLKTGQKVMMIGTPEENIEESHKQAESAPEVQGGFDIDEGDFKEIELQNREENLEKLRRRVASNEVKVLNAPRPGKKLLVLDIDYTLYDLGSAAERPMELARPYLHHFLASAYTNYDIIIWSATNMKWVEVKMRELGCMNHPEFKFTCLLDHQAMITVSHHKYGVFDCKPLGFIWAKFPGVYHEKNTIMMDDLRRNYVMNKQNGLVIRPFKRAHLTREEDMELFKLAIYLRKIAPMESIGSLRHSRWESYIAAELAHGEVDED